MDSSSAEVVALYQKGMRANQDKAYEEAVGHFQEVMELAQPHTQYYVSSRFNIACNLMSASMNTGRGLSEEAIRLWREGVNEGHPGSMYYLAVILEQQNDVEAMSLYIQAAKLGNDAAKRALADLGLAEILLR